MPDTEIELALLRQDVDGLKKSVEELNTKLAELLVAWQTANGVLTFIKILGAVAAAIMAIVAFVKGWRP